MRVKLNEDEQKDKITTVQIDLGLTEYKVLRKLIKMGTKSEEADALDKVERKMATRFAATLFETDEEVEKAVGFVNQDVPDQFKAMYMDPHSFADEEFMVAGILKIPEERIEHESEGEKEEHKCDDKCSHTP